jgi:signal transduction histidine kinase
MSLVSFFEALELRIKEHAPEFTVVSDSPNDSPIDSVSAEALAEATIQAIDNSLKHAGDPTERLVRLRGQKTGLKIAVVDNGRGFRPSKISKNRLGITSSIVKRVEKVGGRAFVQASPGRGTTVIIEWAKND